MPAHTGAESLKKPHHIVTLRFSEVVNDHAKILVRGGYIETEMMMIVYYGGVVFSVNEL